MMFSDNQKAELSAPLNSKHVRSRSQAGRSLSYIEGWHVIAEANRIFGFDGWTRETVDLKCVSERERKVGQGDGWGVTYIARVRITVGGIVREGCGAGHGIDRDLGQAHESALKESETDAMKRGLMTFGNPFGLALYDKAQSGVEHDAPEAKPTPPPAAKPKMTPAEWVDLASQQLLECRSPADLTAWIQENSRAVDKLQDTDKALYNAISQKIANRNDELNRKAA
jgi:DNA recombination protein Rad52